MRAASLILPLLLAACEVPVHLGDRCADCSDAGTTSPSDAGTKETTDAGANDAGLPVVDAGVDGGFTPTADAGAWGSATQTAFIKPRSAEAARFGESVALSADGRWLLAGAPHEGQGGTGVNPPLAPLGTARSGVALLYSHTASGWALNTTFKASNARSQALFGSSVAISLDGMTVAVGAPHEHSATRGVNGDQQNLDAFGAGAVYVFTRASGVWVQEAYLKPSDTVADMAFGTCLALSDDGHVLTITAPIAPHGGRASSGAAYVFERKNGLWAEQQVLAASNPDVSDWFGTAVALSADGRTLAVTAEGEDSNALGLNGNQENNGAQETGAVYLFEWDGRVFSQVAYLKRRDVPHHAFGASLALSADGARLGVGVPLTLYEAGEVDLFERVGSTWRAGPVLVPPPARYGQFGSALGFDERGDTLVVGGRYDGNGASGVNQPALPMLAAQSGAAWVFVRSPGGWTQLASIKASNTRTGSWFGAAAAISADAKVVAIGAPQENTLSAGAGAAQRPSSTYEVGAVYVLEAL